MQKNIKIIITKWIHVFSQVRHTLQTVRIHKTIHTYPSCEPGTCTYHIFKNTYRALLYSIVTGPGTRLQFLLRLERIPGTSYFGAYTTTKLHELNTAMESSSGGWRAENGPPQTPSVSKSVEFWWRERGKDLGTHIHTSCDGQPDEPPGHHGWGTPQ